MEGILTGGGSFERGQAFGELSRQLDAAVEEEVGDTSWYFTKTHQLWQTRTGELVDIGQMADSHLANTIAMLERGETALGKIVKGGDINAKRWLRALNKEAARRRLLRELWTSAKLTGSWRRALRGVKGEDMALAILMMRREGSRLPKLEERAEC